METFTYSQDSSENSIRISVPAFLICCWSNFLKTLWAPQWQRAKQVPFGPKKKLIFSGPTPSNSPNNGFVPIKIIMSKHHIKQPIGNFIYMSFARCHLRTKKVLSLGRPPFPIALVMDFPSPGCRGGGAVWSVFTSYRPPPLLRIYSVV